MGPSPQTVTLVDDRQASSLAELDDLQDLSVGTLTNEVRDGRFAFVLDDLEYLLDGVLPGKGSFDLGRQKPLVAAATIEAVCVAKQDIELQRDLDGRISAETQHFQGPKTRSRGSTSSAISSPSTDSSRSMRRAGMGPPRSTTSPQWACTRRIRISRRSSTSARH
jgi:hypothetical protein